MEQLTIVREDTKWYPENKTTYTDQVVEGDTLEDCFKKLYDLNRTYRYVNGVRYYPKTQEMHEAYDKWYDKLGKQTKFDMYYGGGIVD